MNKLKDTKTGNIFNVEKVKNNSIPLHFFLSKDVKVMLIDGEKVTVMRNTERTQYVAFKIGEQCYYVRDHKFLEVKECETFIKPKVEKAATYTKAQLLEMLSANGIELPTTK